ncbi:MAG: beta-lactamase family protein [Myxococcales bacterium]|nr:beta-lactamase family protein [Myxococcales bacterium]
MACGIALRNALPLAMFLGACGGTTPAPATPAENGAEEARPTGELLAKDTVLDVGSATKFVGPTGWRVEHSEERVVLRVDNEDIRVCVLESRADVPERAVLESWPACVPGFVPEPDRVIAPPADGGWDGIAQINYVEGAAPGHVAMALVLTANGVHRVLLLEGAEASVGARAEDLSAMATSIRAPGVEEESFAGKTAAELDPSRIAALEAFIEEAMAATDVPGVAVGLVQNGRTVLLKGYGLRERGKSARVTQNTRFLLGSTSTALTSALVATLVDRGAMAWDDPLTKLEPSFTLADPKVASALKLADAFCGCAGLARRDIELLFEPRVSPEERIRALAKVTPLAPVGAGFQFSNELPAAGAYIAAHVVEPKLGVAQAYDRVLRASLLRPLGMRSTVVGVKAGLAGEHALPHSVALDGSVVAFAPHAEDMVDGVAPAAGLWSTAKDMVEYLRYEIDRGVASDGERVTSDAGMTLRQTARTPIAPTTAYGLGLFVSEKHGIQTVGHSGNTLGFTSDFWFLPAHRVGLVLLVNAGNANTFRTAVGRRLIELLFDARPRAEANLRADLKLDDQVTEQLKANINPAPAAAVLEPLTGTYRNDRLGEVRIAATKGGFRFDAGEWSSAIGTANAEDGSTQLVLVDPPWLGLTFRTGEAPGGPLLVLDGGDESFTFERTAPTGGQP